MKQKTVELFHLLFLRYLSEKLSKDLYAVKGGCNLRFFFKSIRYSEDLDLDVKTVARETLRNKISKLFENLNFRQSLGTKGIEIVQISEPKQTDTTQRWKIGLKAGGAIALPTKIEFSRRKMEEACVFEPIDSEIIQFHELYPILVNHYTQEAAFCQKISALIHRSEVQARDVFDIHLLLNRGVKPDCLPPPLLEQLDTALTNALSIGFAEFKAQVVAYLMEEYQEYYSSPRVWDQMQDEVIRNIEKAKNF